MFQSINIITFEHATHTFITQQNTKLFTDFVSVQPCFESYNSKLYLGQ